MAAHIYSPHEAQLAHVAKMDCRFSDWHAAQDAVESSSAHIDVDNRSGRHSVLSPSFVKSQSRNVAGPIGS